MSLIHVGIHKLYRQGAGQKHAHSWQKWKMQAFLVNSIILQVGTTPDFGRVHIQAGMKELCIFFTIRTLTTLSTALWPITLNLWNKLAITIAHLSFILHFYAKSFNINLISLNANCRDLVFS